MKYGKKDEDIWNVIKNKLNIKFHSQPIYENKYLKTKVREFDGSIKTTNGSMKMKKKNYPQVYLEECKYKVKKINTPRFINIDLESDSESDAETDLESNTTTEN